MSSILVTGSKGVVGSCLVPILRHRGHSVVGIDLVHAPDGDEMWKKRNGVKPSYARCDVADYRQLDRVFEVCGPFDYVYHTAAEFGRWNGEDYYEQLWRTNAIGTKHIIRIQERVGFNLIHFSSSEVYGDYDGVMEEPTTETQAIRQLNDYAMSKRVNEQQIYNSRLEYGTKSIIVRLFNTYGPGEWYHPYRSVICRLCYCSLRGLPVTVYRGHIRTFTFIEDACRTLANVISNFRDGEIYNIAGTFEHSVEHLADLVWALSNSDTSLISYKNTEPFTTKVKSVNVSKALRDLNHCVTVGLEEGIRRTLDWMAKSYGITVNRGLYKVARSSDGG